MGNEMNEAMNDVVKIVQSPGDGIKTGVGSQVLMPNGDPIPNIISVEIPPVGREDFWTARITCMVGFDSLDAIAEFAEPPSWWRRALVWLAKLGL